MEEEKAANDRFVMDLEFVQALSNVDYLAYLANEKYLQDENFIQYLDYLQYWKKPEYAKFILYPHCLYILDQLQDEEYRKHLQTNTAFDRKCIMDQQSLHWKYYLKLRNQGSLSKVEGMKEPPLASKQVANGRVKDELKK
jgi:mediator of RNA polymerase II transcription subunit 31